MDTTNYKIQKCGGRRCLTCSYSEDNNSFFSNLTGKRFYPKTALKKKSFLLIIIAKNYINRGRNYMT